MAKYTVEKALEDRKKRQREEKYNALYQAALESPGSVARSHTPMTVEEALEERIKERKRNADSYKSDIVKQYNSLVEKYGKYSKNKPFYGVDATKNTRIRQTGISGNISNLITKVEDNRDILGDEDADLILKNLNNMKSGLANEVDASKVLTNFTDEKDLDDFMNPPSITPLIPKGSLAPFGRKDSTPVKKDVGGIYQFDSDLDNSGLNKLMFGSSKIKEPLSTDDVKDEDRLAIYAYYTQKAREAEKSGASEEEVNALLKQAEKARSKEGYQEIMNGWLNNDFELDTETVEARRIIYDRKMAEIKRLEQAISYTPDGEEKDNLVKRKEALEAETNIYSSNQKDIDDYYGLRNNADFDSASQYRDYNNPTEEQIREADSQYYGFQSDYYRKYVDNVDYYDEQTNEYVLYDGTRIKEPQKLDVEDKLGLYLNTSEEDRARAVDIFTFADANMPDTWATEINEGIQKKWGYLKDEEIETYYYLYKTQGKDAAYKFLDSMEATLGRRATEDLNGIYNESNILEKVLLNVATVPANILGGIPAVVRSVDDIISGEEINPYSYAYDMVNFASSVRGQTAADIENATGGAAIPLIDFSVGDAYQAVMSGLDSIAGAALLGKGYTVVMGMNAAANQARDLFDRGASQSQIFWGSAVAGGIEMLTEYISLDNFFKMKKTGTKSKSQWLKQILRQGGFEASEEMVSEILNTAYDAYNMKSQSEWAKLKEEGGFQKAFLDTVRNVINAGIGGLISGAGMAAGQGGVNLAMYNSYANGVGAEINSLGNGQALLDNANALSEEGESDNYIRKLSKKVAEAQAKGKTDTLLNRINTGKLYDTVAETRAKNAENADRNTFKTFVSDAIKDNANIKNKAKAAEIITKSVYDKLSRTESLYYDKIGGKEIINSVRNDKTLPSSQKLNNILSKMALSQTEALRYESQGKQDAVATSKIKDVTNKIDNGEIKVADAQKTESAKAAEIVNIKSVKDGVMTFEMSDGTEVSSNDITYKSKDEGLLYESVLAMGFNERIGNTVVKNLASSGMSVKAYLNNVALAYDYGVTGQQARIDEVLLPKELRNTLYVVGRDTAKANTERLIAKAREEKAVGKATNKVTYVNDIGDKSKLNNNQKATVAVAEFIAASSPLDVRIYKSFRRGNKTYININGVEQESYSNGWYAEGSNIIYIDINAGNSYEGLGVFTLSHEISHYIRHWNAEEWQKMADFIVEVIDKQAAKDSKYATFEYSLNKKFQKYKSNRKAEDALIEEGKLDPEKATYGGKTDTKLRDMAYEDVICDSLASLFQDKQTFVEFSDNLKKTNPSLWEKFKQAIKKFLDKIDNALKEFAGVKAESEAGQAVQDALKEDRDRIRELFTAAFGGANENFSKAAKRGKNSAKSSVNAESKLNSARDTLEERTAIQEMGDNLKDVIRDKDGNMLVATSKDGSVIRYSERTYNNGGKTALIKCLRDNGHTTEEISDTLDFIDRKLKVISNYGQEFASQYFDALNKNLDKDVTRDIATGNQVIFAFTPNGDYPANMDLQLECKKRIAYGEIMKRLISDGVLENIRYGGEAIAEVNMILAENEFETACLGCFVESRRLQFQTWAETFVTEYNEAVARFNPNADYFFGKEGNAVSREDAISAYAMLEGEQRNDKGNLKLNSKGVANKMSELIAKNPKLFAHKLSVADILTPEGLKKLRSEIGGGDIFSLLKQRYGAASPKIVQDFNPYNSEILNLTFATLKNMTGSAPSSQEYIKRAKDEIGDSYNDEAADIVRKYYDGDNLSRKDFIKKQSEIVNAKIQETAFRDYLFDVGGLRIQSFSDFMIENTFDMLQMFTDMSVKEFPIHGYTKEISCIRLFGMTGAKFNGSLIAHVDRSLGKRLAGLMEYTPENARHGITVDLDGKKYVIQFDDFERYNKFGKFSKENPNGSFIQSIGYKDIIATMLDPRYSKNIGNITIGVSDAQIKAMLRNPLFRMIIPYHSSGMIPGFAELVGVSYYNDYTDFQNTTVRKITDLNGNEIKWQKNKAGKYTAAIDGKTITVHFDTEFNFNEEMNRVGDAKQAASNYVAWCDSEHEVTDKDGNIIGYVTYNAKFSNSPEGYDFAHNEENYYKLLEDFNVYDSLEEVRSGKKIPALQEAVTLKYAGENGAVLSEEQLKEYAEDLRNTGVFTENEIKKYVAKAQMTWDEILHKELEGRNEYHKQQDPKIDSTVKQIEDMLLSKYARTDRASNAESYVNAKEKAGKELSKKKGTSEERTAKANEASLMPPEGVYLYSGRGNGYDGYSMSNNARAAYAEGEQPLSKWSKKEILDAVSEINPDIDCSRLTLETLKDRFLNQSSWHHTSMLYNTTDFYSIDEDYIKNLSQEDVNNLRDRQTRTVKKKRDASLDESVDDAYAKVQTIVASGLLKTETGAIRRLLDGKDFDGVYRKAVEILSEKDKRLIDQWRKLPEDHWRQAYVKLWDNDAEDYVRTVYANKRLSRNSNVFKTIENYFKKSVSETGTVLHDERDTSLDPRTLLTNALENAAVTEDEKNLLKAYKDQIDILNKQTKRLAEIKAEIKDISFGKGKDRSKLPGLRESARKFERAISAKDKQLLKLEATKPLQKVLDREKAAVKKKALQQGREALEAYKKTVAEKQREEMLRRRESANIKSSRKDMTYYRNEIKKIREDFIQQLRNGTDRRFVPKPLVESIISVCNAIDPTGRVYYKPGTNEVDIERTRAEYEFAKGESKAVEKYLTGKQALADLKLAYDNLSSENDYDFSSEYDAEFSGLIAQLADSIGDTPLREMSLEQLSDVYNILSDIRWMLKDAARQIGVGETITNYEAGQQIISEMEEIKDLGLTTSKVSDTFRELTLNPMRAVREMSAFDDNAMLVKLFNALNEGRRKADTFRMKTDKKIEAVRDEDRKAYNDAVEKEFDFGLVDINGNEVHITKMQAMFAVLTARREAANANRSHLQTPVLFPDYKLEKKGKFGEAKKNGFEVRLDGKAVAKIMDGLSAWDKRYLAAAEKIYNEDCKNAVNETTMLTKHRAVATEKSYIQYVVNEDYIARDSENIKFDKSILNEGILKSVKDNADQQLIMLSLNTALDDHIEKVAKLYGLAVPIRNWNKVFNMKQAKGYVGDNVKSVKSAIFETWGEKSRDLLDQAVADLQTSRQSNKVNNEAEKVLQKVRSGLTVSVLAANISVAMKQAASYPTAGSILSSYALLKGLKDYSAKIKDGVHAQDVYDEIDAHTSQHWIRRQGLSTQELGELNQSKGWENRLNNKLGKASPMNWIQAIDVGTTAALWYACKVDARRAGYAEGSREYWDKVTELYDKVIEETQPMYDSLHRAEITKGNELVKSMVMFKTQPLQNSGILREGGMELKVAYKKYGKNSEQAKEARMKFVKAVASQAASHFVFTAMTLVSRMLLHKMNSYRDDDDELTFGSIASEFASQYFRNFFGAIVPIVGDVATSIADALIKKGNSTALNSFVVDKVNEIVNAFSKLDEPSVENYTDMLGEIASFFGIPFSNATNIVKGAILHIEDAINGEFGSFNAGQSSSSSGNAKEYVKLISDGNTVDAKDLYNEWVSEKKETIRANREKDGKTELSDSELEKEAKSSVKSSISSYFREMYVEAYKNGDTETTWEIRKQMLATGLWTDPKKTSASVVNKTCNDWEKEYKKPQ